ncbi:hypothetical protein [Desulfobulbus alkaliphilus]|uniref:hypothetical protein n=1 Tax=Desulfobulbus alkaliphilus TaxID=869814 RepID=UPI0019650B9B|nr:hypothetical protein [Desulfobulbus alkaliphilus]MBM9538749.1 hypothetical protein [Desulfobulbus alkaliphilus]
MRCPKCGYTSFDHLEVCKKCSRAIGDLVHGIHGTVYNALAPMYLNLTEKKPSQSTTVSATSMAMSAEIEESEGDAILRQGIDTEFSPENDSTAAAITDEKEPIVDLDELEEVSLNDEFTLDLGDEEDEKEAKLPALDFGDLDISDLAPPSDKHFQQPEPELEPVAALSTEPAAASPAQDAAATPVLEDLQFNGLDLEAPARFVSGSAAGKRYSPSVKTGTALDKFDIDLGDLFKKDQQ